MSKKYLMSETSNTKNILSGIYKTNFPNGKCYIGLSNNIRKRIWKHNNDDYRLGRVVGNAINKYGKITEFEVLEEIPVDNRELMNEREKYWIKYFQSNNKEYGYNVTEGGDGGVTRIGVLCKSAAFNQEQLDKILDLLFNHRDISMVNIAKKFNVSHTTIESINQGKTYVQPNISYPIRTQAESNKCLLTGTKSSSSKLNEEQLKEVINLIQNSSMSFTDIAKQYNVHSSTIGHINNGKTYYNNELNYPLRDKEKIKQIQYKR